VYAPGSAPLVARPDDHLASPPRRVAGVEPVYSPARLPRRFKSVDTHPDRVVSGMLRAGIKPTAAACAMQLDKPRFSELLKSTTRAFFAPLAAAVPDVTAAPPSPARARFAARHETWSCVIVPLLCAALRQPHADASFYRDYVFGAPLWTVLVRRLQLAFDAYRIRPESIQWCTLNNDLYIIDVAQVYLLTRDVAAVTPDQYRQRTDEGVRFCVDLVVGAQHAALGVALNGANAGAARGAGAGRGAGM
jgi:hypothetical protein